MGQALGLIGDPHRRLPAIYERADLALTFFEFTVALLFLYFAGGGG